MLRLVYNVLFAIAFFLYIPKVLGMFFFRKHQVDTFLKKLGLKQQKILSHTKPVWIHAVSLGEIKAAYPLILQIAKEKKHDIVVSCVTKAGFEEALKYKPLIQDVFYLPFDFHLLVKPLVLKIDPSIFILVEGDIWPELVCCLKDKQIPTLIVNAKISQRSFKNYQIFFSYAKWVFSKIDKIYTQSKDYAHLFEKLSVQKDNLAITGNMKFDYPNERSGSVAIFDLKEKCNFSSSDKLIVLASTHPNEEKKLLASFQPVLKDNSNIKIIIVPRHAYRFDEVALLLESSKLTYSRFSSPKPTQILLVDQMGVLSKFYEIADLAIVGGSFEKIGGHNILEPLFYGVPTFFGPHMHKQQHLRRICLEEKLCRETTYEKVAQEAIEVISGQATYSRETIEKIFNSHRGVAERNWCFAKKLLNFSQ